MKLPSLLIGGDTFREGGQGPNIDRIASTIIPFLDGWDYGVIPEDPLPTLDWLDRFENGPYPHDADLLIGFELPPGAKRGRWIDVRRHPIRFGEELWSITSSIAHITAMANARAAYVPKPESSQYKIPGYGCFTCQVGTDASMIRGNKWMYPEDFVQEIRAFADKCSVVEIVKHPLDPNGEWPYAVYDMIHNGFISDSSAYKVMDRAEKLLTVTSSTGFEARYFDCDAQFLAQPVRVSGPVRLNDEAMWVEMLSKAKKRIQRKSN